MGAWGSGNIENDTAQDMLAEICDDYFRRITDTLRSEHGHEYDEYEHDELFVLSELLLAMNERGMVNSSPEPEVLRPLFAPFMERWAAYFQRNGYLPPPERQKVMEDTIRKLVEMAEGAHQGSFAHRIGLIADKMSEPKTDEDLHPTL